MVERPFLNLIHYPQEKPHQIIPYFQIMETETLTPMPPLLHWQPEFHQSKDQVIASPGFKAVLVLEPQQIHNLERISNPGVFWKNRVESKDSVTFRLSHGGDVDFDGNCLFSSAYKVIGCGKDSTLGIDIYDAFPYHLY